MNFPHDFKRFIILGAWLAVLPALAQETNNDFAIQGNLMPVKIGARLDDNVFRSTLATGVVMDQITSLDFGGKVNATWGDWGGELRYDVGGDSYSTYDILDNLLNDGVASLDFVSGNMTVYLEGELFLRSSHSDYFNYEEDSALAGMQWSPDNQLNMDLKYKFIQRQYGNQSPDVWSQNFNDNSVALEAHRVMDDRLTLGIEGNYTNREFNRYAVVQDSDLPGTYEDAGYLQTDQSYGLLLSARVYAESILQNFTVQHERTDSNSFGFSNTVDSFSWAAVVRPAKNFYVQLFVRLYEKTYDQTPLVNPDLQVGFTDEDSQDLLSVKGTWEFESLWSAGFSYSRMKTESTQPGEYYIKNVEALQIERKF